LFVMVEAVEAECRRLLAKPPPTSSRPTLTEVTARMVGVVFPGNEIVVERHPIDRSIRIRHRCKACDRWHTAKVDEASLEDSNEHPARRLYEATRDLLEQPCTQSAPAKRSTP
jgi:hypothetical protein